MPIGIKQKSATAKSVMASLEVEVEKRVMSQEGDQDHRVKVDSKGSIMRSETVHLSCETDEASYMGRRQRGNTPRWWDRKDRQDHEEGLSIEDSISERDQVGT